MSFEVNLDVCPPVLRNLELLESIWPVFLAWLGWIVLVCCFCVSVASAIVSCSDTFNYFGIVWVLVWFDFLIYAVCPWWLACLLASLFPYFD